MRVKLHSDSAYPIYFMNQKWYGKWRTNGWRNSKKKPVENRDLWEELLEVSKPHAVQWIKVRIRGNERYDALVREEINETLTLARS